jgi:hypothetical protein
VISSGIASLGWSFREVTISTWARRVFETLIPDVGSLPSHQQVRIASFRISLRHDRTTAASRIGPGVFRRGFVFCRSQFSALHTLTKVLTQVTGKTGRLKKSPQSHTCAVLTTKEQKTPAPTDLIVQKGAGGSCAPVFQQIGSCAATGWTRDSSPSSQTIG